MGVRAERRPWTGALWGVLALLVVSNVLTNRVLPNWLYVPWNVAVTIAIVVLARREVSMEEMGFGQWRRGAVWGGVLLASTAAVLLIGTLIPVFHEMFHDRRVEDSTIGWLYQAFVRIPLGTALLEEAAFRAVLPAMFATRIGVLQGCLRASFLFGLWHVLPAWNLASVNPVANRWLGEGVAGTLIGLAFAVSGTMLAGLWWCWVRYRSGSVLATILGHVATNSVAYTIAFFVGR